MANRGKFHSKNNGVHFGGEIVAVFGVHHFGGHMTILFFNARCRGGLGHGLYLTKPLSNFLSNILKFITIFLNLKGCQNPKI